MWWKPNPFCSWARSYLESKRQRYLIWIYFYLIFPGLAGAPDIASKQRIKYFQPLPSKLKSKTENRSSSDSPCSLPNCFGNIYQLQYYARISAGSTTMFTDCYSRAVQLFSYLGHAFLILPRSSTNLVYLHPKNQGLCCSNCTKNKSTYPCIIT